MSEQVPALVDALARRLNPCRERHEPNLDLWWQETKDGVTVWVVISQNPEELPGQVFRASKPIVDHIWAAEEEAKARFRDYLILERTWYTSEELQARVAGATRYDKWTE